MPPKCRAPAKDSSSEPKRKRKMMTNSEKFKLRANPTSRIFTYHEGFLSPLTAINEGSLYLDSCSRSTIRALNKNFSIAFFFPAFITLLFYQHNRTVYDIVAGTIVVKRNRLR